MIPTHIIELAIKGGWQNYPSDFGLTDYYLIMHDTACMAALDPDFWMALGKEMGWTRGIDPDTQKTFIADPAEVFAQEKWKDNAHHLLDLILRKASPEEITRFWEAL